MASERLDPFGHRLCGGLNLSGTGTELAYTVLAPLSLRIDQSTEDDDASLGAEAALSAELTGRFDWGQNLRVPVHSIPSLTLLAERSSGGDFMRADIETGQVTLTSADDDAPDGTYAAKAEEVAFDLISGGATAKGTDTRATGAFEKIEATASLVETLGGSMRLIGGALTLPGYDIDLSGVTATLPFTAQGIDGAAEVSGLATHAIDDPAFAPLRISASLSQNADGLAFTGTGQPRGADASLSFNGGYAFAEGTTRLDFGPDTITFEPKGLQPADISRIFGDLKNVKGDIVLEGDWVLPAKGAAASQAQITFDGVDGDYYIVTAAGIEGTLALVDFTNPKTALPQTLTARAIKAPLPLEAPSVTFEVLSTLTDPAVRIGLAEGTLADGRVFVADTAIAIGSDAQDVTVEVERIDLEALFNEWTKDQLTGTGRISGTIPTTITPEGLIITDGRIAAEGEGVLNVHWGGAREALASQGQQVELLVQVLEDFHYDILEVGMNRPPGEQLTLQVRLQGNNPAVLDGYPFNLNIGLSGNLETLLGALAEGQQLTMDMLRQQMDGSN